MAVNENWGKVVAQYIEKHGPYDTFHKEVGSRVVGWDFPQSGKSVTVAELGFGHREHWTFRNQYHRDDGPALIFHGKSGQVFSRYWYYRDVSYDFPGWVEKINDPEKIKRALLWL